MSGGYWDYGDCRLCDDIFRGVNDYRYEGDALTREVRRANPLEDAELSELVWDVFQLLHSYDWYASGDTSEEDYREDAETFKDKWLKCSAKERTKREIDKALDVAKNTLYQEFGIKGG